MTPGRPGSRGTPGTPDRTLIVWVLAWAYVREADRDFDPLEEHVRALAERGELTP